MSLIQLYSTLQYSTVQYNTVLSVVQYRTVQYSTAYYITVQWNAAQCSTLHHGTSLYLQQEVFERSCGDLRGLEGNHVLVVESGRVKSRREVKEFKS